MKNADTPAFSAEVAHSDGKIVPNQTGNTTAIYPGLTKREYFAGLFMAQIIAGDGAVMVANRDQRYDEASGNWKEVCAMNAIEFADELLKQLES